MHHCTDLVDRSPVPGCLSLMFRKIIDKWSGLNQLGIPYRHMHHRRNQIRLRFYDQVQTHRQALGVCSQHLCQF